LTGEIEIDTIVYSENSRNENEKLSISEFDLIKIKLMLVASGSQITI